MNELGIIIIWCALQVTVVAIVTQLMATWGRRRLQGGSVVCAGLLIVGLLSAGAFSPWPRWEWHMLNVAATSDPRSIAERPVQTAELAEHSDGGGSDTAPQSAGGSAKETTLVELLQAGASDLNAVLVAAEPTGSSWRWPGMVAAAVSVLGLIGLVRVGTGIVAVERMVARGRLISDSAMTELVDILCAELACRRPIRLLESSELATAATTGWQRPAILLPAEWRSWTDEERRAVLAHEIAHVLSRDFLACVAAQCSLAIHFYHPLVHWLVRSLRMDLELAADATAASVIGPTRYLQTLANMALRQDDRPLGWPARTFLPTRGTFLRRIEMLRDNRTSLRNPRSGLRVFGWGVVALAGLAAAGIRGAGTTEGTTLAGTSAPPGSQGDTVEWVPADAAAVLVIRPKELLAKPEFADLLKNLRLPSPAAFELHTGKIEQLTLSWIPERVATAAGRPAGAPARMGPPREFAVVKFAASTPLTGAFTAHTPATETEYLGVRLHVEGPYTWCQPDDRTLVLSSIEQVKLALAAGKQSRLKVLDSDAWRAIAANPLALACNTGEAKQWFDQLAAQASWLEPYAPVWSNTTAVFAGATLTDQIKMSAIVQCRNASDVGPVSDTLAAAVTMAKNASTRYRGRLAELPNDDRPHVTGLLDVADVLLNSVQVERQASHQLRMNASTGLAPETARMITVLTRASSASARAVASNNLKQLMLAVHNYHDIYGRFPPSVVMGKDGKGGPPHSWRIELLPFLEAAEIHNAYRFDEPWDSESNKALIARMPAVFRHPSDAPGSTNTAYFGLIGPGTVFSKPQGVAIQHITDGTSNTIALVEARRAVPWTKPDDIVYSPDQPLPEFGVNPSQELQVAFCDGSVRTIPRNMDPNLLRAMITIAGGEVIPARP
jgi:beta-lactamase regulating signal transducer with metallopeptidase domain